MSKDKKSIIEAKKKEKLLKKQEKERLKQEQRELKLKLKEFNKKYFSYYQTDKKISNEVKEELTRLGSYVPPYSDSKDYRAIQIMRLWDSDNQTVKEMLIKEAKKHFSINDPRRIEELLTQICQTNIMVKQRMKKMKEAREEARFKNWGFKSLE